jgi:hypothetical protein
MKQRENRTMLILLLLQSFTTAFEACQPDAEARLPVLKCLLMRWHGSFINL